MTTEKQSEPATAPTVNDNKAVFGPLGKYAVVAVIMVSIIVTTAITLDQQLNTVEDKIAAIESVVAETHVIDSNTADTDIGNKSAEAVASTTETDTTQAVKEVQEVEAHIIAAPASQQITEAPSAEVLVAIKSTPDSNTKTEKASDIETSNTETVETATSAKTRQTQIAMDDLTRIEAYKLEQKQRMAEMFARIRLLESQQLDKLKTNQDEQITRLRDQVSSQQQIIDNMALRNKELFEMRAANVQRNQTNREQVLNRI